MVSGENSVSSLVLRVGAGRRNSHSEHEALREMKNELMAQWDGIRSGGASPSGPRIMVSRPAPGFRVLSPGLGTQTLQVMVDWLPTHLLLQHDVWLCSSRNIDDGTG